MRNSISKHARGVLEVALTYNRIFERISRKGQHGIIGNGGCSCPTTCSSSVTIECWQWILTSNVENSIRNYTPLTEENHSIWMTALLKLWGVLKALENPTIPLGESDNTELKIWLLIKEKFASSQSSNWAQMFNDFLYVTFQEDLIESLITEIKVAIKKLVDVGIEMPQDIMAYLLDVEYVCNHLTQFNNESKADSSTREKGASTKASEASKEVTKINLQTDVKAATIIPNKTRTTTVTNFGIYILKFPPIGGENLKLNGKIIKLIQKESIKRS
ncbi:hypothetical protein VP01_780g3 [Puccinia sorghi]|uniref:Uncharacterized protein n=1 Tax=Puccinia sorghi TaxID=27349 RepID=A0A0L6UC00_9BASI|nr:hypothetical protein VP01_780g3 [Puccinia sorghi]